MKNFKDFEIKSAADTFKGTKVSMSHVLNREIQIHAFRIEPSKHPEKSADGKCLWLQISIAGTMHVLFSGSGILMEMIRQVPVDGYPFTATIVKENDWFKFT